MNAKELELRVSEADRIVGSYLPAEEGMQKIILEAMNYSVLAGGKRVRPILMNEVYKMLGGEGNIVEPFMAAIEMIHTYSLVHDDLPAMDNDDYRRGKLTTHKKYGEAMGVLAGDALLNYAFEIILKSGLNAEPSLVKNIQRAGYILATKAGIYGMIGGQTIDVEWTGRPVDADTLDMIFRLKTGALIEASMMVGAVLAGADDEMIDRIQRAAAHIGTAFQIQDDILDVTSTAQVLGKPVYSDEKNNKTTYVSLYGMEQAVNDVRAHSKQALELLGECGDNKFLMEFVEYLINREK